LTASRTDAQLVDENLRRCFRVMASTRQHADIRETGGVAFASAGVTFQMFNAAFLAAPEARNAADLERRIAQAAVHFRARGISWSFWVCDAWLAEGLRSRTRRVVERRGLNWAADLPGMVADGLRPPRRALPRLEVRPAAGERERLAFCDIGAVCFRVPLDWFREIFLWEPVWSGFRGWVGYHEGEPVATAGAVLSPEAIGVYNVATLPAWRRRGFGEAVLRHALAELRRETGCERVVLQSTDLGLDLYAAMGFRTVTKVSVFASAY
jgi:ribosomal protein S18 acetylase RimI-like enzyme